MFASFKRWLSQRVIGPGHGGAQADATARERMNRAVAIGQRAAPHVQLREKTYDSGKQPLHDSTSEPIAELTGVIDEHGISPGLRAEALYKLAHV